jgi:hypothetical protein
MKKNVAKDYLLAAVPVLSLAIILETPAPSAAFYTLLAAIFGACLE